MTDVMDAKIAAVKIKRAIEELREGAQEHLDSLQAQQDEANRVDPGEDDVEPEYPSEDEMNTTQAVIDELDEVIMAFEDKILPLLRNS